MKVLFAASEAVPFVKTGGLADVIGSLPKALVKQGADVRVILPKYEDIPAKYVERMEQVASFDLQMGWRKQYCGILKLVHEVSSFILSITNITIAAEAATVTGTTPNVTRSSVALFWTRCRTSASYRI